MSLRRQIDELKDLFHNALPLFFSSSLSAICSLVFFKYIGSHRPENHYIMSLYLPFAGVGVALVESLKIPFYVNAKAWQGSEVLTKQVFSAIAFGLILVGFYIATFALTRDAIVAGLAVPSEHREQFLNYALWMLLSGAPAVIVNVIATVLFVKINAKASFLFNFATMVVANITSLALYFSTEDLRSIGVAMSGAMVASSLVMFAVLIGNRFIASTRVGDFSKAFSRYALDYGKFSLSYILTFVAYGAYSYAVNTIVTKHGVDLTAVFGIFARIQNILILPAVAMGTYTAVTFMSRGDRSAPAERSLVHVGLKGSVFLYALLVTVAFAFRTELAEIFTTERSIVFLFEDKFPWILAVTFLLGPIVFLISFLEQSGRAARSLVLNVSFLSLEVFLCVKINAKFVDINSVLTGMIAIKIASLFYIGCRNVIVVRSRKCNMAT